MLDIYDCFEYYKLHCFDSDPGNDIYCAVYDYQIMAGDIVFLWDDYENYTIQVLVPKDLAKKYYPDVEKALSDHMGEGDRPSMIDILRLFKKDFSWRLKHIKVEKHDEYLVPEVGAVFLRKITIAGVKGKKEIELKICSQFGSVATLLDMIRRAFDLCPSSFFNRMWLEYRNKEIYVRGTWYEV